jgi:hypothetical protein
LPTIPQLLGQADHNERFFESLDFDRTPFSDWAIIGMFYAALHYLKAVAHTYNCAVDSYSDMDNCFAKVPILSREPDLEDAYRQLKDDSMGARYHCRKFTSRELTDSYVEDFQYVKGCARRILRLP